MKKSGFIRLLVLLTMITSALHYLEKMYLFVSKGLKKSFKVLTEHCEKFAFIGGLLVLILLSL